MKELYSETALKAYGACEEIFSDYQSYLKSWSMIARRSVAFANGDQNPSTYGASSIIVDNQPVTNYKFEQEFLGYQTNEIEPIVRTLQSYMTRARPTVEIQNDGNDESSKAIAKVAEDVINAKYELDNEFLRAREASFWLLTIGNIFFKDYWDYNAGTYINQYNEETGQWEQSDKLAGNNRSSVLTPFHMILDHSVLDFEEQPYVGDQYVVDVDWAREAFNIDLPGYTGKASKITESDTTTDVMSTLEGMKFNVPYLSRNSRDSSAIRNKTLIKEVFVRPNKSFPKGRLIIHAGDECVYISDAQTGSPYFMPFERTMWHPYSFMRFEEYVGRFLGKSLVEQLVPIQMRINEINKTILLNANTIAKPNILYVEGSIKQGVWDGSGSKMIPYKNGFNPPAAFNGIPLPQQFFNEKQMLIDQMVRIAGTNFVMQGQTPTGVTAAAAIQMLLENSNTQYSDLMGSWEYLWEQHSGKKIRILKKFMSYPDPALRKKLSQMSPNSYKYQKQDFIGAEDLSDGINIEIERGSTIPKNQSVKKKSYMDLIQTGILGPGLVEDSPRGQKMRDDLVKKLELEPLENEQSVELKKALWENGNMGIGQQVPIDDLDDHIIHIACHKTQVQDPNFRESKDPQIIDIMKKHIAEHQQQLDLQAQEEDAAQQKQLTAQQTAMDQQKEQQSMQREQQKLDAKAQDMLAKNALQQGGMPLLQEQPQDMRPMI